MRNKWSLCFRKLVVALGCLDHTAAYLFCLFWQPEDYSPVFTAYILLVAYGFADAVLTIMATGKFVDEFRSN